MSRNWLALVLCGLVVLSGCQAPSQLFGSPDVAADGGATPTDPSATATPTGADASGSPTATSTATGTTTERVTPTPTTTEGGPFDEAVFRESFRADIAQVRDTRGLPPLSVSRDRQRVADAIARDLATVGYFGNATAQNSSRFDVRARLVQAGLQCGSATADDRAAGGGFFFKGFYRQYINNSGTITYYETEQQLARSMTDRLLEGESTGGTQQLSRTVYSSATTNQSLGLYRTPENAVYVVYVVC